MRTEVGPVRIQVPRDRAGSFAPRIVPKHVRRLDGFNEAILSLYPKGLTTGEIAAHLADVYDADVSRELISRVTDSVLEEMEAWRQRPLDRVYPVAFHRRTRDEDSPGAGREPARLTAWRHTHDPFAMWDGNVSDTSTEKFTPTSSV